MDGGEPTKLVLEASSPTTATTTTAITTTATTTTLSLWIAKVRRLPGVPASLARLRLAAPYTLGPEEVRPVGPSDFILTKLKA